MRRRKSREERAEDFRRQAEAREQQGVAPTGPGQTVPFNPNPPTAQPPQISFKVTHHSEQGDVPVDPSIPQQLARQVQRGEYQAGQVPPAQDQPRSPTAQQGTSPQQPPPQTPPSQQVQPQPGVPQQGTPAHVPQQPSHLQQPQQNVAVGQQHAVPPQNLPGVAPGTVPGQPGQPVHQAHGMYGQPQMPVTRGEVAPTSAQIPNSTAPGMPSGVVSPGMSPSHLHATPGVYAPSMQQVGGQPGPASVGPQQLVVQQVEQAEQAEPLDVTVIFTSWSRPGYLRPQYLAIAQQSRPPVSLYAYVNPPPLAAQPGMPILDEEVLASMMQTRNTVNLGPWPRFELANLLSTEYVVILDDDAIPGTDWLEEAIRVVEEENVCVAVTGALYDEKGNETLVGGVLPDGNPRETEKTAVVDVGRQGWVLKREWLGLHFLAANRLKFDRNYGWDVHLAATLQEAGIDTVVLPYGDDSSTWGTTAIEQGDGLRTIEGREEAMAELRQAYRDSGWTLQCESKSEGE